jgi:hypothetical protein
MLGSSLLKKQYLLVYAYAWNLAYSAYSPMRILNSNLSRLQSVLYLQRLPSKFVRPQFIQHSVLCTFFRTFPRADLLSHSRGFHAIREPEDKAIAIDARNKIQVLDTMMDLATAEKEQRAAFIVRQMPSSQCTCQHVFPLSHN